MQGRIFLLFVSPSLADPLPAEFTGHWAYLYESDAGSFQNGASPKCTEREGVDITSASIVWNTEGDCQIEKVKRTPFGGRVAVSLMCLEREGRVRPKKVRRKEIWSVFKTGEKTLMSQMSAAASPETRFRFNSWHAPSYRRPYCLCASGGHSLRSEAIRAVQYGGLVAETLIVGAG
jgi:hypothetical protein